MDPNKCLEEIIELCNGQIEDDRGEIIWKLEDLLTWLRRGGFIPQVATKTTKTEAKS